jgi:hypothetical protein
MIDHAIITSTVIYHIANIFQLCSYLIALIDFTYLNETSIEPVFGRTLRVITYTFICFSCDEYVTFNVCYYGPYVLCFCLWLNGLECQ